MKYLVTGGSGFIGSALVKRLVKEKHHVLVFDNNSRGNMRRLKEVMNNIEFISGDIRDKEAVVEACRGMDAVFHLAYINGTEFFYTKPELILEVATKGMMNILDGCLMHNIKELILASSSEVYQQACKIPTDENVPLSVPDPLNPRYSYGGGKIISELLAINYGRKYFSRVLIFRPHNVFGPDMGWEHVIPQFILRFLELLKANPNKDLINFNIQGSGNETRSFIYIDDFIDGVMCLMKRGEHNNIYHIGTDSEIAIREVASFIADYFKKKINIIPGDLQKGSTLRRCPDIRKISELGFRPKFSFKEGISQTSRWYYENSHLKQTV